tara:strand:- start:1389 stop:1937 length:549 start_codon:yes stop_codon:yes gene_type:complete
MAIKFKDFTPVDYMPGEDDLIKRQAVKRKKDAGAGTNAEYSSTHAPRKESTCNCGPDCACKGDCGPDCNCGPECGTQNEALTMTQRRAKSRQMKKYQARLKVGRKKASMKVANAKVLGRRARKAARNAIAKKLTKGVAKADLTPARKQEIEKRLDKMAPRISRLAKKLTPKLRQAELGKKRG